MISISSYYGNSSSAENNAKEVRVGNTTFYFSYETIVAVFVQGTGLTVRNNDWGPTTGKHLNAIDGGDAAAKAKRVTGDEFEDYIETLEVIKVLESAFA